jgi:hypothetical protein
MNAEIVYQVAKALPKEEQRLLFDKLKLDLFEKPKLNFVKVKQNLTKEDALLYLIKNVFEKGNVAL